MASDRSENDEVKSPALGMPELRIRLEKNEAGWADLMITLGGVTDTIWLSQVQDPFCDIADWGRKIEDGDLPAQVVIDEEGSLVKLSVLATDDPQQVLFRAARHIPAERELDKVLLEGIVDRTVLARTMQSELRRYFTTDFDPWQWDMHSYDVFDEGPPPTHVRMLDHGWIKP